jgi:hypothetical protein
MASYIGRRKFLATLSGAAAKHWAETRFYQYRGPNAAAPTSMKRRFPRGSESRSLVDGGLF